MRRALAVQVGVDLRQVVADLLNLKDVHAHAVGNLVPQVVQRLFADDLRAHDALGLVGNHVVGEVLRALGHGGDERLKQCVHVVAPARRDGEHAVEAAVVQRRQLGHQLFRGHDVDLVHREELRALHFGKVGQHGEVAPADALSIHHRQHRVHALLGFLSALHHELAQLGARRMQTGRVHEHDLPVLAGGHAQQLAARGLGMVGDDGHLFADKAVHQAGLAHVRAAHDGHKTGTEFRTHIAFSSRFLRATPHK